MTLIYKTIERGNTSCKAASPGRGTFPNPSIATGPVHTDIKRINAFAHGSNPLQLTPSNRSKGGHIEPHQSQPRKMSKEYLEDWSTLGIFGPACRDSLVLPYGKLL